MGKLIYSTITSLDGYVADEHGNIEWGAPDPEVFTLINDLERTYGTVLYGRRMYETMVYWETFDDSGDAPDFIRDFTSIWRAANKIVYSRTLDVVTSARTRLERSFDVESVRAMKASSDHDLAIGGANLASQAIEAGLVDEMHLFVTPVTIGGGTPAHPERFHSELDLVSVERFAGGVVHLHYAFNT